MLFLNHPKGCRTLREGVLYLLDWRQKTLLTGCCHPDPVSPKVDCSQGATWISSLLMTYHGMFAQKQSSKGQRCSSILVRTSKSDWKKPANIMPFFWCRPLQSKIWSQPHHKACQGCTYPWLLEYPNGREDRDRQCCQRADGQPNDENGFRESVHFLLVAKHWRFRNRRFFNVKPPNHLR